MPSMHASGASYAASPGADHPDLPSKAPRTPAADSIGLGATWATAGVEYGLCEPFDVILMDMSVLPIDGQEATSLRR